jgi:murein DD-endopeptidase MepM/ murein hydrolase activator NlpD
MKIYAMIAVCLVLLSMVETGSKYPNSGFNSPVNREIKLSGTFGELRTNHFHAGLDIKSKNGVSGDPVYAATEGFISRIRVEEFGYGNALYLEHPNGYTSVYAHLDRFAPEIEQYVKSEQYKNKSFEVDLYPSKNQFPLQASQQIGFMGNTGYSFGPHLHFEIRHTDGQIPVNPLHFGLEIEDHTPPVVQQLIVYSYNEKSVLINTSILQPKYSSPGEYTFEEPIEMGAPMVTFGLRTFDTQEGATNQNGVYGIQCKVDDEPSFAFTLDEIPFEQTRYLNAHIDYRQKINDNKFFHRCRPLEGNKLPIYYTGVDKGMTYLNAEQPRSVTIDVSDFKGNKSTLAFKVIRDKNLLPKMPPSLPYLTIGEPDKVSIISQPGLQVVWPKGSFYEKTPINVEIIPSDGLGCYTSLYAITPADVPVHFYFDILIEGLSVPAPLRDKVFIARCEADGSIINCGGNWIGNNLTTGVRQMSTYTIMADTIAPKISVLHFGPKMTGWSRMAFKISDNFRTKDRGKDLVYNAWVDGEWILMSLDGKSGILTHQFDGRIPAGEHQLVIKLVDDRGNEAVLEKTFTL